MAEKAGGGRRRTLGVCAVCRTPAPPSHFHTAAHRERAAAWERKHDAEVDETRRLRQQDLKL